MKIRLVLLCAAVALFSVVALAADISGKWTAEMPGRGGQTQTVTFTFKLDGDTLTGTMQSAMGGPAEIKDGKVNGDEITFIVVREFQGNSMKTIYTGKVSGDEIKFTQKREGGQGQAREFTAKRSTT